jgi:hypothetical protein
MADIVLAANEDGRLELFTHAPLGSGAALWHASQTAPNGDWSSLSPFGDAPAGSFFGAFDVAQNKDGRLEVAVLGGDHAVWHRWQTAPNGDWSDWSSLGHPGGPLVEAGPLVLARNGDGRLEVFTAASDGAMWHRWHRVGGGGWVDDWSSLGGPGGLPPAYSQGPVVGQNGDGRLELFAVARSGMLWHRWQRVGGGGWADWSSLGQPNNQLGVGMPVVGRNNDGRLEVFATASDGAVWHRWQRVGGGGWADWSSLGSADEDKFPDGLAVAANADGGLVLVATLGPRSAPPFEWGLWQQVQTTPDGIWYSWSPLDHPSSGFGWDPTLGSNADGRLELVFSHTSFPSGSGGLYRLSQLSPNGDWSKAEPWPPAAPSEPQYQPRPVGSAGSQG